MVQKLSSIKQQNHLKEGHKGGLWFEFVGKLFNLKFFEGNLELLTLIA